MDKWVQLANYPKYAVHPDGHIKNLESGCVLAQHANKKGYSEVCLVTVPGSKHRATVHQLIAETFIGACPVGYVVDHKDRNRANSALTNLQYILKQVNDAQGGIKRTGEKHYACKLSTEQVKLIKWKGAMGISSRELAKEFKVDRSNISYILSGKTRQHG